MSTDPQSEVTVTFDGVHLINAERMVVWRALQDPAALRRCLPGCEDISGSPETGYEARLTQRIGPMTVSFAGQAKIEEITPHSAYAIRSTGYGGLAGYAQSIANITLIDVEGGTELTYHGRTLLGGFQSSETVPYAKDLARNFADQFFEALQNTIEMQTA